MNAAPATKKVRLKRVAALSKGDTIIPGMGLFTREGVRLESGLSPLGLDVRTVVGVELDSSGLLVIDLEAQPLAPAIVFAPADSYAVLA